MIYYIIINKIKSILSELIFLLSIIFNIISRVIKVEIKNKRRLSKQVIGYLIILL